MRTKILLIEDEKDLGQVVKQYLEIMDFEVTLLPNGKLAWDHFSQHQSAYDMLLIDVSMPEMDGFEFARRLVNANSQTSFLFLTARNEKIDRLQGLKLGADDYISKPFDIDELVLRIRNIIKRNHKSKDADPQSINCKDVQFVKDRLQLVVGNHPPETLTPREAELLEYLFKNENKILRRTDILNQLWKDDDYFLGRSLDVFISRLRKHLVKSEFVITL